MRLIRRAPVDDAFDQGDDVGAGDLVDLLVAHAGTTSLRISCSTCAARRWPLTCRLRKSSMTTPKVRSGACPPPRRRGARRRGDRRQRGSAPATRRPSPVPAPASGPAVFAEAVADGIGRAGEPRSRQKVRRNSPLALSGPTRTIRPRSLASRRRTSGRGSQRLQFAVCSVGLFIGLPFFAWQRHGSVLREIQ